jgi:glycosyltransferase involved in cell wall biosynthesis
MKSGCKMINNIKVSIIVPIYKVEKYLHKCLDSIVNQTLKDIEIILIDDCGGDNSIEIAKEFAKNDSRIKIVQNLKNKGQGYSRNVGIRLAKGEYIAFVDSDDRIESEMYEILYKKALEYDLDIVKCDFYYEFQNSLVKYDLSKFCSDFDKIYKVKDNPLALLGYQITTVWNGMYKKEFLIDNSLFFNEIVKYEDMIFSWGSMLKAQKIMYVPNSLYYYLQINSLSDTNTEKYYKFHLQNTKILGDFIEPGSILNDAYVLYVFRHFQYITSLRRNVNKKEFKNYRKLINKYSKPNIEEMINKGFTTSKMQFFLENNYNGLEQSFITKLKKIIKCYFI